MTRTVDRKPITQAMALELWRIWGKVFCAECGGLCTSAKYAIPGAAHRLFGWDHHLALVDGGTHSTDNLRPVCLDCHARKSAHEHKNNAKAKRVAKKHANPLPPGTIKSRGFDKTRSRKMDGRVVPKNPASADNTGA